MTLKLLIRSDTPSDRVEAIVQRILRFHRRPPEATTQVEIIRWDGRTLPSSYVDPETRLYAESHVFMGVSDPVVIRDVQEKWRTFMYNYDEARLPFLVCSLGAPGRRPLTGM